MTDTTLPPAERCRERLQLGGPELPGHLRRLRRPGGAGGAKVPSLIENLATGDGTEAATAVIESNPPQLVSYGLHEA